VRAEELLLNLGTNAQIKAPITRRRRDDEDRAVCTRECHLRKMAGSDITIHDGCVQRL
jgi:hypothetical protein